LPVLLAISVQACEHLSNLIRTCSDNGCSLIKSNRQVKPDRMRFSERTAVERRIFDPRTGNSNWI
jgi:hypothetical protein